MFYKVNYIIVLCILITSCTMQDNKRCDLLYEKALDCWCKYSLSHDTLLLRKSEQYLDSSVYKPFN